MISVEMITIDESDTYKNKMRIQIDTLKQLKTKTIHKNKSQNLYWSLQSKIKRHNHTE